MMRRPKQWLRYALAMAAHHGGADWLYRKATGAGLVVLMLHRLRDAHDPYPLSLSRASFRQMVGWLRERRALVGLEDGLHALNDPHRAAVHYAITFDDGYRDNLDVLEEADARHGPVPAVVYVATGHVGGETIWAYRLQHAVESRGLDRLDLSPLGLGQFDLSQPIERERLYLQLPPRLKRLPPEEVEAWVDEVAAQLQPRPATTRGDMLDWPDIRTLEAGGVRIGAHTRHHVLLSRVDAPLARAEIHGSCADIRAATEVAPAHFAYPNGGAADFGERDVRIVREAGFATAVTSIEGTNRPGVDPYRILRHNVHEARYRAPSGRLSKALFFSETSGLLGWLRTRRAA
jgi:peptidoglycan/xylan/chitin deacetylase (PgdA/CDA1 family)